MLDFVSEDIDGMDDDAGGEEESLPTGHWTATSSYDIYMVDTPKEGNGDGTAEDDPSKKQLKRQRQQRRSNPAKAKAIPAPEIIALRTVPKATTILSSKI